MENQELMPLTKRESQVAAIVNARRSFPGSEVTMYVHQITFKNGDMGDFLTPNPVAEPFVVGKTFRYTIQEQMKNGFKDKIIKLTKREEPAPNDNTKTFTPYAAKKPYAGKQNSEKSEMYFCARSSSMQAVELVKSKAIPKTKLIEYAQKIFDWQIKVCKLDAANEK